MAPKLAQYIPAPPVGLAMAHHTVEDASHNGAITRAAIDIMLATISQTIADHKAAKAQG